MTKHSDGRRASLSGATTAARDHAAVRGERRASANQEQSSDATLHSQRRHRRTALEHLLDMELGVTGVASRRVHSEDNQDAVEGDPVMRNVSLELLAIMSPHGTAQHWEDEDNADETADAVSAGREPPTKRWGREITHLTSPTHHMAPFQPSPAHSAHGDEFDLASPVALPESPQQSELWNRELNIEFEETPDNVVAEEETQTGTAESKSRKAVSRVSPLTFPRNVARASRSSAPHAWTPGRANQQIETKPKIRHGGIYSLLLKNHPPENEPVLLDERKSPGGPEVSPGPYSVTKKSSPPSFARLQHGGIYGALQRNSKNLG